MQIICPNCTKKFKIQDSLIPSDGRLVQCGGCDHKWFYNNINNKIQAIIIVEPK